MRTIIVGIFYFILGWLLGCTIVVACLQKMLGEEYWAEVQRWIKENR